MHYKKLLDPAKYLGPQDFMPEREVVIKRIAREKMPKRDGEPETSAPMLYIQQKDGAEYPRPLKVPKSVLFGLSLLMGPETDAWIGKKITPFAGRCMSFGEVEECVRIRFPAEIDGKVRKWLKKRKANPKAYLIGDAIQSAEQSAETETKTTTTAADLDPQVAAGLGEP